MNRGVASKILEPISDAHINIDMIVQNIGDDNNTDFTFTVPRADYEAAKEILENTATALSALEVRGDDNMAKVSVVGVGMRSHAGVATTMFKALANERINIILISTSEIKISVVIEDKYLELAVRSLHKAFQLDESGNDITGKKQLDEAILV